MKARRWLAALVVPVLVLTGCVGDDEPTEEESTAPLVGQAIHAVPRADLVEGGELRLAVPSVGGSFNPLHSQAAGTGTLTTPLLPNFFDYDASGVPTPNPDFVTDVQATGTPTVVTITLNPKATWGDGDLLSWADVAATVQACNGTNAEFQCATNRFSPIEKVERGQDDQQVVVTFKGAYPEWATVFRGVSTLRAESVADPTTFNDEWTTPQAAWLSGPFTFDRHDADQKVITLVPNPKWWGEAPLLQRLTYREIAPDAAAAAYINNQVDTFNIGIDPDGQLRAQGASDGEVRVAASPDSRELLFNTSTGVLADQQVRRAIVSALDRDQIARTDLEGLDWTPRALNSHVWVENQPHFEDMSRQTGLGFNVEEANRILDEAGWVRGEDGVRTKDDTRLTIAFTKVKGMKASELEGQNVQKMLGDVGIEVTFTEAELAAYTSEELMASGGFEMIAITRIGNATPYTAVADRHGADSPGNWSGWTSEELQGLLEQLSTETDEDKRVELSHQIDAILWENAPSVPLYQLPESVAIKRNVANYGAFGLSTPKWTQVGFTATD